MKTIALLAAAVSLALASGACAAAPEAGEERGSTTSNITGGDGTNAAVAAIDRDATSTDGAGFKSQTKDPCKGKGYGEYERVKLTDAKGVIRKVVSKIQETRASNDVSYYYDAQSHLRLVQSVTRTLDGDFEARTYFDANGKTVWCAIRMAEAVGDAIPDLDAEPLEEGVPSDDLDANAKSGTTLWSSPGTCDTE